MNAVAEDALSHRASLTELKALGKKIARFLLVIELRRAAPKMDAEARTAPLSILKPAIVGVPPELAATNRVFLRWAASIGTGIKRDSWEPSNGSGYPPLEDPVAVLVDRSVMTARSHERKFVRLWYKTPIPRSHIAKIFGVSRSSMHLERNATLGYFRARFRARGLSL